MSTKKSNSRVLINTGILILMSVIFGALTFCGVSKIQSVSKNFQGVTNAPALCFDETHTDEDGYKTLDGAYICDKNGAEASSSAQSLFVYDKLAQYSILRSNDLVVAITTIGSILTVASLLGAVVYLNHNRS